MSGFSTITNKYAAKAKFSGNIVNGLYVYSVDTTAEASIGKAVFKEGEQVLEFEKPFETSTVAGNKIKVSGGDVTVSGYDYLGQPISETIKGSSAATSSTSASWKYIEKIDLGAAASKETTVTLENDTSVCSLPFKSIECVSATKNTAGTIAKTSITVTAPNVTANGGSTFNTRGTVALTGTDSEFILHLIADNSTVTIDDVEVGGLYGNPING